MPMRDPPPSSWVTKSRHSVYPFFRWFIRSRDCPGSPHRGTLRSKLSDIFCAHTQVQSYRLRSWRKDPASTYQSCKVFLLSSLGPKSREIGQAGRWWGIPSVWRNRIGRPERTGAASSTDKCVYHRPVRSSRWSTRPGRPCWWISAFLLLSNPTPESRNIIIQTYFENDHFKSDWVSCSMIEGEEADSIKVWWSFGQLKFPWRRSQAGFSSVGPQFRQCGTESTRLAWVLSSGSCGSWRFSV